MHVDTFTFLFLQSQLLSNTQVDVQECQMILLELVSKVVAVMKNVNTMKNAAQMDVDILVSVQKLKVSFVGVLILFVTLEYTKQSDTTRI